MRLHLLAILVLVLVLLVTFLTLPAIHDRAIGPVACLLPPAGLELPAGQGIEIRCHPRLDSAATIDLLVDRVRIRTQQVGPGDDVALSWIPERAGSHTLVIVVRQGSREVSRATCRVVVVSAGSPVRVLQE